MVSVLTAKNRACMVNQTSFLQKQSGAGLSRRRICMGPERKHNERSYTRRRFITTGASASAALYLAACGGSSSSSSSATSSGSGGGKVTLNNLFQQQAGYSASDLAGMTAA